MERTLGIQEESIRQHLGHQERFGVLENLNDARGRVTRREGQWMKHVGCG